MVQTARSERPKTDEKGDRSEFGSMGANDKDRNVTGVARLLDIAGVVVSRCCSAKAAKHKAVFVLASAKLNTVHSHISKALEDCNISDDKNTNLC